MSREILEVVPPPADSRLPYGPAPEQFGDLRLPAGAGPHPVVVTLHGGFWRNRYGLGYLGHLCEALRARGVASWNIEYRRLGDAGGGWPGTFLDAAAATDVLRTLAPAYALDLGRVLTLGHSAGGHLALWLAGRRHLAGDSPLAALDPLPLAGAVSLAGVIDLRAAWELALSERVVGELLGGGPEEVADRYAAASPLALVPLGVPTLVAHGTADEPVPFALAEGYVAAARAAGDDVALLTLQGAGHFELVDPRSREWAQVLAWITARLALL